MLGAEFGRTGGSTLVPFQISVCTGLCQYAGVKICADRLRSPPKPAWHTDAIPFRSKTWNQTAPDVVLQEGRCPTTVLVVRNGLHNPATRPQERVQPDPICCGIITHNRQPIERTVGTSSQLYFLPVASTWVLIRPHDPRPATGVWPEGFEHAIQTLVLLGERLWRQVVLELCVVPDGKQGHQ